MHTILRMESIFGGMYISAIINPHQDQATRHNDEVVTSSGMGRSTSWSIPGCKAKQLPLTWMATCGDNVTVLALDRSLLPLGLRPFQKECPTGHLTIMCAEANLEFLILF